MQIALRNGLTGQIKLIKLGWSWTLFLFGSLYGIPLFIRRVPDLGITAAIISGAAMLLHDYGAQPLTDLIAGVIVLGLATWLGSNGNRLTGVRYLERGWFFAEPDSELTKMARGAWKLDDTAGVPRTLSPEDQTRAMVANAAASQRDNVLTAVGVVLIIAILVAAIGSDAITAFFAPPDQPS